MTQIPALIVSTAAGLLVSKAAVTGAADKALRKQLSGYPKPLGRSAGVMLLLLGIPMLPFVALGGGAAALAWSSRNAKASQLWQPRPRRRPTPQSPPPARKSRSRRR